VCITNRLVLLASYISVYMMFYDRQFVFIVVGIFFLQNMVFMFVESPGFVCYALIL